MNIEKTTTLVLHLTPEEAVWLHGVMQNPLHTQDPHDEDQYDAQMRRRFFDATQLDK